MTVALLRHGRPDKASSAPDHLKGMAAAGVGLGVAELFASLPRDAHSPLSATGRALIDLMPPPLVDVTVGILEDHDKPALAAGVLGGALTAGALAGRLARSRPRAALLVTAATALGAASAAAVRPETDRVLSALAPLGGACTAAVAFRGGQQDRGLRKAALQALSGSAAGALAWHRRQRRHDRYAKHRAGSERARPASGEQGFDLPGLSPLFTPNKRFYVTDVTFRPPVVDPRRWRLRVEGMVERPFELSLPELIEEAAAELDATLACVHNPVGGPRIGTARWLGVPVADLLRRAGVMTEADQLVARSVDGFTAGVPLELIDQGQPALVVVSMNGEPLPRAHGAPARLLMPGLWGADANTKWLSDLEVTTFDRVVDYWDRRGWPRQPPPVKVSSRIDLPSEGDALPIGLTTVAGVAWAPPDGVCGVEVAIDDGPWREAELSPAVAPTAWRQWRLEWEADPGEHELRVRAHGRSGPQSDRWSPPYPDGSSGLHRVRVLVTDRRPPIGALRTALRRGVAEAARRGELATGAAAAWSHYGRPS